MFGYIRCFVEIGVFMDKDEDFLSKINDPHGLLSDNQQYEMFMPNNVGFNDRASAEYIATQVKCKDFKIFSPLFDQCRYEILIRSRKKISNVGESIIKPHRFFMMDSVLCYIAELEKETRDEHGRLHNRTRCIYENGKESDILLRTLVRALNNSKGFAITDNNISMQWQKEDVGGYIYVAKIHGEINDVDISDIDKEKLLGAYKIGFTAAQNAWTRTNHSSKEDTYAFQPVDILERIPAYKLDGKVIERILHKLFRECRLNLNTRGSNIRARIKNPEEWFDVPYAIIIEALRIMAIDIDEILRYKFDSQKKKLLKKSDQIIS